MTTTIAHHSSSNSFFQFADAAFLVIIQQRVSGQLVESLHKTVEIVEHWWKIVMKLKSVLKCGKKFPLGISFSWNSWQIFLQNLEIYCRIFHEKTLQQNVVFATIEGHDSSHICEENFVISCVYCDTYYAYIIVRHYFNISVIGAINWCQTIT